MSEWSPWGLDASAVSELRLSRAIHAMDTGDPVTAALEAEELLDEDPDNLEAIVLVGEASLDLIYFATARIAFQHALSINGRSKRQTPLTLTVEFEHERFNASVRTLADAQICEAHK